MKCSWMRKKDRRSGKKKTGGQKRSTPPLSTLLSLSRKETLNPFCDHDCSSNSSVSLWLFRRLLRSCPFDKASSAAFCFSSCSRVYFPIAQLFTSDLQCSRSWDGWMVVVFGARNLLQELLLRAVAWVVVQCRAEHPLRADFSCFSSSASCIQWR